MAKLLECLLLAPTKRYLILLLVMYTEFDLISAHTPISAQSSFFVVFKLQPMYLYLLLMEMYVDTYVVHVVTCVVGNVDKSRLFK